MDFWIDTHSHIYQPVFDEDIEELIQRCLNQNVQKIVLPNIDVESLHRVEALSHRFPEICLPTVGLHPCDVKENFREELKKMGNSAFYADGFPYQKIYAIGETGLDYYWDITFKEEQKEALKIQIQWAKQLQLPIILHTRNSVQETIDIIREHHDKNLRGVFHCFSGNLEEARQIIELEGFYLGIGGPLTYKKSVLPDIISEIPLEKIVLETDAPYLPPDPYRGKRNESSYIPIIAQKMAEVKNCTVEKVQFTSTQNAIELFKI